VGPLIEFVRGNGLMGEILADFSVQNPTIDSQVVGLIAKGKRSHADMVLMVAQEISNLLVKVRILLSALLGFCTFLDIYFICQERKKNIITFIRLKIY